MTNEEKNERRRLSLRAAAALLQDIAQGDARRLGRAFALGGADGSFAIESKFDDTGVHVTINLRDGSETGIYRVERANSGKHTVRRVPVR